MGKSSEIKELIVKGFPKLQYDEHFEITSPEDCNYNCIAWAYQIKNRWMWPPAGNPLYKGGLDAVTYWPNDEAQEPDVKEFIKAFEQKGYRVCDDSEFENGYRKIALYIIPGTTECTHAARQLSSGYWTSKLGESYDIQHGTPYTLEGRIYGSVYCIMKKEFK